MAAEQHVDVENAEVPAKKPKYEQSILENFNKLTNGQEKIRIKSGVNLLKHLSETTNNEKENEIKYALGRLIRGVGSSKTDTRTGYFTCLVGLLNLQNTTVEEIFEIVNKELHKGGSNSKSENADICSGQILVAGAILRTDLYENSQEQEKKQVLELLINAGKERTYLNLAAYTFLIDLYNKITPEEFNKIIFPLIKDELTKPWPEHNLDTLFLLLETERKFPKIINSKFLSKNLGTSTIICSESLSELCHALTTLPRVSALKHPVFAIVTEKLRVESADLLVEFFEQLDQNLTRSNRNKYFVTAQFLIRIFENLPDSNVLPNLLTKNFVQQTIATFKTAVGRNKDREFQLQSTKLFESLLDILKKDETQDSTRLNVLKRLIFFPGTFIFEKVTKTRLVQNITLTLKAAGVKSLAEIYTEVILAETDRQINENQSEKWWNIDRVYASHLLTKLLNHPAMHEENQWKIDQLKFIMQLGIFTNEAIGSELADSFKETFFSSLDLKLSKLEDLKTILFGIFSVLKDAGIESNLREPLSSEDLEMWNKTYEICMSINGKKKKKLVFQILFLHLGLQLFNNVKLASDSLKELFSCYERIRKKPEIDDEKTRNDELLWIEVMVDLFLNLLSHNSHLLRTIIGCVFPHLCKYLNVNAIHQILSVLDPKNETNPLSKYDEDSSESEESDGGDDDDEKESNSDSSEVDEDSELDEEETANDKLRLALQQALGEDVDSGAESVDLDELDEDAGEKLDEALGQAFKKFKPNLGRRKKQSKDDQTLTHFRVRVLDLIEIYLNTKPSMLLSLEIMLPLLQTLEFSIRDDHQKPLQDRVRHCLKTLTGLRKFDDVEGVTDEILVDLLKSFLEKGTKNAILINDMGEKISDCCVFVINCFEMLRAEKKSKKKRKNSVWNVVKEVLEVFFSKRDCPVPYVLFKNVLQLNYEGILELYEILIGFIFTETVRPFRRYQAIELLKIFYTNHRFINGNQELIGKSVESSQERFLLDCVAFFKNFEANEKKIKLKFLTNLFELLNALKCSKLAEGFEGWSQIGEGVRECRSRLSFSNDAKATFRKLCKSLNISHVVEMKPSTVKLNNDEGEEEQVEEKKEVKKKKNKKLNKEKLKLKKETKELRLESLSQGIVLSKGRKTKTDDENETEVPVKRVKK